MYKDLLIRDASRGIGTVLSFSYTVNWIAAYGKILINVAELPFHSLMSPSDSVMFFIALKTFLKL